MNLLLSASLIVTPTVYNEGTLFGIVPTNPTSADADFSVTRATTATRVNAAGLVELVPYNLISRSEEFTFWTPQNATISANTSTAPNGTLTADKLVPNTTSAQHRIYNSAAVGEGVYSVYAKADGYNFISLGIGGGLAGSSIIFNLTNGTFSGSAFGTIPTITSVGNGWYRCSIYNPNLGPNASISFFVVARNANSTADYVGDGTSGVLIWGAQVVEGTSALDYQMTETRLNIPRLDYSLGSCPNILLEPQRTNLTLWSEQFDNAWWSKSTLSITANTTTSPSGVVNADTLDEGTTSSIHRLLGTVVSVTAGSNNSFSLYVKKGTMRYFRLVINDGNDTSRWIAAQFDLDTQTFTTGSGVGGGGTIVSSSIQSVGNGWFRVNLVGSLTLTGQVFPIIFGSDGTAINAADGRGGGAYSGTNKTLFLWGAQLEAGAYATSYIPTTSASVTRNQDQITRNNVFTNGLITASGGTWFVDLRNNIPMIRDLTAGGVFINTGTSANINTGFAIRQSGGSNQRSTIFKVEAGSGATIYNTLTDTAKIAIKWNGTTADVFVNGVKVVTATAFTATNMNNLIGEGQNRAIQFNSMALFPTPLTDDQCIALTTL